MSIEASIDISYSHEIDIKLCLESLLKEGWHYNDYGKITFFISEDFEWRTAKLDEFNFILNTLCEKYRDGGCVGIALLNENNVGGLFHFFRKKKSVMILLSINRTKISNSEFTNFSYYIERLIPILNNVSEIRYSDVI